MDPDLRRSFYCMMLTAAVGLMVARIANVEVQFEPSVQKANPARKWPAAPPDPWPTFGSNDRARWATVKALVEERTFVIGRRVPDPAAPKGYTDTGILFTDGFKSVDVVLHPDRQEFYATKPPLLTLLVAGEYWVMHNHRYTKWNLAEHRWEVVVTALLATNVLPLAVAFLLLSRLLEAYGRTDWGRLFVFAVACYGTFLTTFSVTLNNHLPAACCVFYALYAVVKPRPDGAPISLGAGLVAGLFAGLAVCLDLPAASLVGALAAVLLFRSPRTLLTYVPAAILPLAAQTYVSHAYTGEWAPIYAQFGGPWYEYEGSHWAKRHLIPKADGIDFADDPKPTYAFHFLFGHHGLFSLTPVWLLAVVGLFLPGNDGGTGRAVRRWTLAVLAVVVAFYIWKTNNYGGWTSGPRWLFWLTPLFLLGLLPTADALAGSRMGRAFALLLFAAGVFAAVYPWVNPWRHPWIYHWGEYMGWFKY